MKEYYKNIFMVILGIIIALVLINIFFIEIKVYDYEVSVGSHLGFNVDSDKIYFGTILPNGASKRSIVIQPPRKAKVYIKAYGDLKEYVTVTENNFIIEKLETKEIDIILDLKDTNVFYGHYKGKILLFFMK